MVTNKRKLYGSVIVTYRCNAHCNMCDCFKYPTSPQEEISLATLQKLPQMAFTNITGGEPFLRKDLADIVALLYQKTNRIVISTNGYFTQAVEDLCGQFPALGIRVSIEGQAATNDTIRGLPNGFKRGCETLSRLLEMGHQDIGFGITVQDKNCEDLLPLYNLANDMGLELATATLHNSFYFRKTDNHIEDKNRVAHHFELLVNALLASRSPKKWARAYFNHGLINYIYGNKRLLPCNMGTGGFFIDPLADVLPCNGSGEKMVMGNLQKQSWEDIWRSQKAAQVRGQVKQCKKNCWMIGSATPAMRRRLWKPALWVINQKLSGKDSYQFSSGAGNRGAANQERQ